MSQPASAPPSPAEIDSRALRQALGQFATGIAVVTAIDPHGQPFNAEHHQAMAMQESAEVEPNSVLNVFQKGYLLNGRLLRPAMVVVSKAPSAPQPSIDEKA